jgi:hypothetical protein
MAIVSKPNTKAWNDNYENVFVKDSKLRGGGGGVCDIKISFPPPHRSDCAKEIDIFQELRTSLERAYCERDEARAYARILAHAFVHDSKPPEVAVQRSLAYPVLP